MSGVDTRVQALNLGPAATKESNLQGTVLLNRMPDNSFVQHYPDSYVRPPVGGSVVMNTLPNSGYQEQN
jgi:hypothetical protein